MGTENSWLQQQTYRIAKPKLATEGRRRRGGRTPDGAMHKGEGTASSKARMLSAMASSTRASAMASSRLAAMMSAMASSRLAAMAWAIASDGGSEEGGNGGGDGSDGNGNGEEGGNSGDEGS